MSSPVCCDSQVFSASIAAAAGVPVSMGLKLNWCNASILSSVERSRFWQVLRQVPATPQGSLGCVSTVSLCPLVEWSSCPKTWDAALFHDFLPNTFMQSFFIEADFTKGLRQ